MKKHFNKFQNTLKKERGITLIALVITIVILIILATVAINAVFKDGGLIDQAEKAKDLYNNSAKDEETAMSNLAQQLNELWSEEGGSGPEFPTPPGGSTTEEGVPIPEGFYYVGGSKNDGVVISDNSADVNKGAEHDKAAGLQGNQFVWVPVENLDAMFETKETVTLSESTLNEEITTTSVYSKLRIRDDDKESITCTWGEPGDTSSAREPDVLPDTGYGDAATGKSNSGIEQIKSVFAYSGTDAEVLKKFAQANVDEYKEMYESVKKYKGFYIGRYELSGDVDTPTSKAGTVLASQNWYNLKKACMNIIKGKVNTKSTMVYGNQWDETMNWLKNTKFKGQEEKVDTDSSRWGNYEGTGTGKVEPTGSKEEWSANHIYDLAGNCVDWTQEAIITYVRGTRGRWL